MRTMRHLTCRYLQCGFTFSQGKWANPMFDTEQSLTESLWERWRQQALRSGVPVDLVRLGVRVMSEAIEEEWPHHLQVECGSLSDPLQMIRLALQFPDATRQRWEHLLWSDGELVDLTQFADVMPPSNNDGFPPIDLSRSPEVNFLGPVCSTVS